MPDAETLYARAAELHGHMCAGTVLGTRMAVLGMRKLDLVPGPVHEDLTVFVETVRCATDAVQATTRCTPGRRSLRILDFGKMAATFSLPDREEAVRVVALESSRGAADRLHPEIPDTRARQLAAYRELPDDALFFVERVRLYEAPAAARKEPRSKALCPTCCEAFDAARGAHLAEGLLCAACAGGRYYHAPTTALALPEALPPSVSIAAAGKR